MEVLIYDGECNVCSKFIRLIVRFNRNSNLYITDFNSNWTQENVMIDSNIDSMIFMTNHKKYYYSDSIIHLLASVNYFFKPILIFKLIPRRVRDRLYKFIAKNRKRILKSSSCSIPSNKAKKMFLS